MTVLLPNKSVSVHIFQKINEHVSMLFWHSRVIGEALQERLGNFFKTLAEFTSLMNFFT